MGCGTTDVAIFHYPEIPQSRKQCAAPASRHKGGDSEGRRSHYILGVTKAGAHTGIEADICPGPRTSVHSSGRETDVPVRDPVSTAHSTHRSYANRSPVVGMIVHNEWEDRGVGQKILHTVGALLSWIDATTEQVMHWPNGAFPTPGGYFCPNIMRNRIVTPTDQGEQAG